MHVVTSELDEVCHHVHDAPACQHRQVMHVLQVASL